jgi:arylsulfatase A-like enzyme
MSHPTNWTVTESIRFLEKRDPDLPFFLMTSFVRPHPPFDAPSEYFDLYRNRELTPPAMGTWEDFSGKAQDYEGLYDSPYGTKNEKLNQDAMAGYYACITHMDHQIGRLLQALYREELLEDSILIFLSDHGELMFDHGLFRKVQPYQGSIRIPLIVRVGKNLFPGKSQVPVCRDLVEIRDIMPTILDSMKLPLPEEADGQSFFPSLFGEAGFDREYLHGEHSGGEISNHFIVTRTDKYIWYSQTGEEHYFRLDQDPGELHDFIHDPGCKDRISYLKGCLIEALKGREEGYTDGISLIPGKQPAVQLKKAWDKQEHL